MVGGGGADRFRLLTEARGWQPKFTLEGAIEGGFRFMYYFRGDLQNAAAGGFQQVRAKLKSPACQVGNGGLTQIMAKALRQHGGVARASCP